MEQEQLIQTNLETLTLEQLNQANIDNLTNLWKLMGVNVFTTKEGKSFYASTDWPHRIWYDWENRNESIKPLIEKSLELNRRTMIPLWNDSKKSKINQEQLMSSQGLTVVLEQMAMVLTIDNVKPYKSPSIEMKAARTEDEILNWIEVASQSFAYTIDIVSINRIKDNPDVQFIMGLVDSKVIATGLIFEDSNVAGIHLVGVLPEYRGQGIARQMMHHIINLCCGLECRYMTLQASSSGASLYRQEKFIDQFVVTSYSG